MEIKCWICGEIIEKDIWYDWNASNQIKLRPDYPEHIKPMPDKPWRRYYCDKCEKTHKEETAETKKIYIQTKAMVTFERAVSSLEKQNIDFYDYRDAIEKVKGYTSANPEKFGSSHEVIAAIILIKNGVNIKPQHQIEKYKADFYIPQYKCVLEIDGQQHKHNLLYDSNRDIRLREILGGEWEIVRIPTEYLDKNAKLLVKAIKEIRANKQKLRAENHGVIPEYYSARDRKKLEKIAKMK